LKAGVWLSQNSTGYSVALKACFCEQTPAGAFIQKEITMKQFCVVKLMAICVLICLLSNCVSSGAWLNRGIAAYEKKNYAKAVEILNKAAERNDKEINAKKSDAVSDRYAIYRYLGWAYLKSGDIEKAKSNFEEFLDMLRRSNNKYYNQTKFDLEQHLSVSVAAFQAWDRGNDALRKENYDTAITEFTTALELEKKYAVAYEGRGDSYFNKGDYEKAEIDYNTAIMIHSRRNFSTFNNLGKIYYDRGEYDNAVTNLEKAVDMESWHDATKDLLSRAKGQKDQNIHAAAQKQYEEANVYRDKGDYTNAIAKYRAALKNDGSHADARKNLKALWDRRIAENPNLYPAPFNGSWTYAAPVKQAPGETVTYTAMEAGWVNKTYYRGYVQYSRLELVEQEVRKTRTIPAYTVPELPMVLEFNGSTYRKTESILVDFKDLQPKQLAEVLAGLDKTGTVSPSEVNGMIKQETKTGTFYYNGDQIELDDGTVLRFTGNAITNAWHRYTKPGAAGGVPTSFSDSVVTVRNGDFEIKDNKLIKYWGNAAEVRIPDGVTGIDDPFSNNKNLTTLIIPGGIKSIRLPAFTSCSNLAAIRVEKPVSSDLGLADRDGVLFMSNFTNLVRYPTGKKGTRYDIPAGVRTIGPGAFWWCDDLRTIIIPPGVTTVDFDAFFYCLHLESLVLPESLTVIGKQAFYACANLGSITIPARVTKIGDKAFSSCEKLTAITMQASVPPELEGELWDMKYPLVSVVIYVPAAAVQAYKNASGWRKYADRIRAGGQ
jgi:tetratricopeptide (TPR) repeat protein